MTEITRVPLQPIAKGALPKLWIGLAAIALAAGGIAWAALPPGVSIEVVRAGTGETPAEGEVVFANYTGTLADGTVFDKAEGPRIPVPNLFPDGAPMPVGGMIPGMNEALKKVQKGGKYVIEIPGEKAYGDTPPQGSNIPVDADLTFELEVVEIMPQAEFQQRYGFLEQMMMQAQQQQGGSPHGGPGGGAPMGAAPPAGPPLP